MKNNKELLHKFWNEAACGEEALLKSKDQKGFIDQSLKRYELEPYILDFADFKSFKNKSVLEIGVGMGSDHYFYAKEGAKLTGIDLTQRAIELTKSRLQEFNLSSSLSVDDAENLKFDSNSFDLVYSWGVIHHSPNTKKCTSEIHRVLKDDGLAKIMIYNYWSLVGLMLWIRYALFALRPFRSLSYIYSNFLESPGTKAYTKKQARELFKDFKTVSINIELTHGDLLSSYAGQRHEGKLLNFARKIWPRWLLKKLFKQMGLFLLIEARK